MQAGVELLQYGIAKGIVQKRLLTRMSSVFLISVRQTERFPPIGQQQRFVMHHCSQLPLKVAFHPHIVVTGEEMYGNAAIRYAGHGSEKACKPLRDHILPLVPVVKHISEEIDRLGAIRYRFHPSG